MINPKTIFGRLTLESFPLHEPILLTTFAPLKSSSFFLGQRPKSDS